MALVRAMGSDSILLSGLLDALRYRSLILRVWLGLFRLWAVLAKCNMSTAAVMQYG